MIEVTNIKENASAWFGDSSKVAGRDYATLTCKVLWNGEDTLYVLYEVYDKLISMEGEFPWTCDSFELFLNLDNNNSGTMIHYQTYADGNNTLGHEVGYDWHENNHIYEIAVDVSAVADGNFIGIDFQYNDDAEGKGERNVCLGWSDTTDKASSDVSVYGQCELSTTTVASLAAPAVTEAPATEAPATEVPAAAPTTPAAPATADMGIIAACTILALSAGAVIAAKKR
ncbi:MAG: hypothetical protein J6I45_00295 [Clostridia bacterium]|nr:hypothetical protein [Clostridia bacterium]